ncbi:MAG: hypothetical protein GC179_23435 [Anaerolineaceae bacterium]|nr:hypothetical protein [Anaerolineaceae bacterium]
MSENEQFNHNPESEPSEEKPNNPVESFIYHQRRALEHTSKALEALLPEGFREHGASASKEFIKSFQVLVDAAIGEIEKATTRVQDVTEDDKGDGNDKPSTTGRTKVKVEVE